MFKGSKNIVIATMDYSDNEYSEFYINVYPYLVFFKHEEKPKFVPYQSTFYAIDIYDFIARNTK